MKVRLIIVLVSLASLVGSAGRSGRCHPNDPGKVTVIRKGQRSSISAACSQVAQQQAMPGNTRVS
jgi:hypothetical protein